MAMGIVSNSDFDAELEKLNPDVPPSKPKMPVLTPEIVKQERGRGEGSTEVPESLRKIIGDEANTNGRADAVALAKMFGLSPSSASAYAVGATSTASYDERPNLPTVLNAREKVAKRARAKLHKALSHLTDEKLERASAKDVSGVAKDMSTIMANMEDKTKHLVEGSNNQFVVYSPTFKNENHYETVVVKE